MVNVLLSIVWSVPSGVVILGARSPAVAARVNAARTTPSLATRSEPSAFIVTEGMKPTVSLPTRSAAL